MTKATIRDLLSYRVHRLANALSRGAALRYRRDFDVSLMEWRMVALLGGFGPLTLRDLAAQSGLDKSQASRSISALVARGLVLREAGQADGREIALSLSEEGRSVHAGLMAAAQARDKAFHGCLNDAERAMLDTIIDKLEAEARRQVDLVRES